MTLRSYLDKNKVLLEDPPYYALIAAAQLVADPDSLLKIEQVWGQTLKSRQFDVNFGVRLVGENPEFDMATYLFAAVIQSDSNNMALFARHFPALVAECHARYHAPGGRLSGDGEVPEVILVPRDRA